MDFLVDVLVKELRSENYTNSFGVILLNDVAGNKGTQRMYMEVGVVSLRD